MPLAMNNTNVGIYHFMFPVSGIRTEKNTNYVASIGSILHRSFYQWLKVGEFRITANSEKKKRNSYYIILPQEMSK